MQIIQSRLRVVILTAVANGVNARNAATLSNHIAPGIIGISAISRAPMGNDCDHVALEVQNVIVDLVVIFDCIGLPSVVIAKIHDVVGAAGSPGLAHQAVFGVTQMLGVLLDGTVIRLVAMNQAAKAVILIVYRLPGGHVKLFRQIAFSIMKILVLGGSVPGFFGGPAQRTLVENSILK